MAADLGADSLDGVVVADVEVDDLHVPSEVGHLVAGGRLAARSAEQDEVRAGLGKSEGHRLSEAASGAGHDGAPTAQVERRADRGRRLRGHRSSRATGVRSV